MGKKSKRDLRKRIRSEVKDNKFLKTITATKKEIDRITREKDVVLSKCYHALEDGTKAVVPVEDPSKSVEEIVEEKKSAVNADVVQCMLCGTIFNTATIPNEEVDGLVSRLHDVSNQLKLFSDDPKRDQKRIEFIADSVLRINAIIDMYKNMSATSSTKAREEYKIKMKEKEEKKRKRSEGEDIGFKPVNNPASRLYGPEAYKFVFNRHTNKKKESKKYDRYDDRKKGYNMYDDRNDDRQFNKKRNTNFY